MKKLIIAFTFTLIIGLCTYSQNKWTVGQKYLLYNGKPKFITGANYIPSKGWLQAIDNWDTISIENDMIALEKIEVECVRFSPLWYLLQNNEGEINKPKLDRVKQLVKVAGKHHISVQLCILSGFVSSAVFTPAWANGKMFKDPKQIERTAFYVRSIAREFKNNPNIHSFDFGNEVDALKNFGGFEGSPDDIKIWLHKIYAAFKEGDSDCIVTNGLGNYDDNFRLDPVSKTVDFLSVHTYPYFNGTMYNDPWIGQRTTYSLNFIKNWAEMAGKPVLTQEFGMSREWLPTFKTSDYFKMIYMSNWANNSSGFFWWCSHDIDTAFHIIPDKITGRDFRKNGTFESLEYSMGLLNSKNQPYPIANSMKECAQLVEKLGQGWEDKLPVCYLLISSKVEDMKASFGMMMNAYVLAKQAHLNVRLLYEDKPIPDGTATVIIPCFSLSEIGKMNVKKYLEEGGTVYQSYYNDFDKNLVVSKSERKFQSCDLVPEKTMGDMQLTQKIHIGFEFNGLTVEKNSKIERLLTIAELNKRILEGKSDGLFFKSKIAKGTYFFFAGNLENALNETYNPWNDDDSYAIYSCLRPDYEICIDSKFVEFYHKQSADKQIVILINHSEYVQNVILYSKKSINLTSLENNTEQYRGSKANISMQPAETKLFYVNDN